MIQGITALLKSKLTSQTHFLIKDFHDLCLQQTVPSAELIVENLTDGQIWHQMNQNLNKSINKWNKFLNKVEPMIVEEEGKDGEQQDGGEMEEEEYEEEEGEQEYGDMEVQQDPDQQDNQQQQEQQKSDQMLDMQQQDVGLYGQLLDDQNQQKYDFQQQQQDPQLQSLKKRLQSRPNDQPTHDDQFQDENFDHFRQIQQENQQQQHEEQPQDQITQLENKLLARNDWRWKGQISSKQRPINSLVQNPMQFMRGLKFQQQGSPTENAMLEDVIKRRVLDEMFDDRVRIQVAPGFKQHFTNLPQVSVQKSKHSLGELYEMDFTNSLGMKGDKQQREKKEILALFKEINYKLDRLSNFSFIPKPIIQSSKITGQPYILREQNVPITSLSQNPSISQRISQIKVKSQKEQGSTHLRTKRIKRQRRKEQQAKRMKRVIEYGGMSKVEAEARKKIQKSKRGKDVKYSQSGQFFKKFEENIKSKEGSKPNPNIGKLKL